VKAKKNQVPEPRKTLATLKELAHAQRTSEFEEGLEALASSAAWSSVGQYITKTWLPHKQVILREKLGFINNSLFHNHTISV